MNTIEVKLDIAKGRLWIVTLDLITYEQRLATAKKLRDRKVYEFAVAALYFEKFQLESTIRRYEARLRNRRFRKFF